MRQGNAVNRYLVVERTKKFDNSFSAEHLRYVIICTVYKVRQ